MDGGDHEIAAAVTIQDGDDGVLGEPAHGLEQEHAGAGVVYAQPGGMLEPYTEGVLE
jgi:hypothetical protein